MIKIYNTLTRAKEIFEPQEKGKVKMYVCGPTVYNYIHLGNARPLIVFDTIRRYLEYRGYEVIFVQNFTDVDDKIINRAKEESKKAEEIAEKFINEFFADSNALNVKKADINPKVTENIEEIISYIQQLIDNNMAYIANGSVYFRTKAFKDYGKLSNQSINDLLIGARIEVDEKKESPIDFVLWKKAKSGEIYWSSPFGDGRPGWHIECSVMANKYLGQTIDIHAGGADLIFPHHENELAQSECLSHEPLAKYWMHNGYINIDNEKMSKSIGNFFTVKELLKKYDGNILRLLILSVHYRSPINFSEEIVLQAKSSLERIKTAYTNIVYYLNNTEDLKHSSESTIIKLNEFEQRFVKEMDDDFNSANAISVIFDLIKYVNISLKNEQLGKNELVLFKELINKWLNILGIEMELELVGVIENNENSWIEEKIEERAEAKRNKNWLLADKIRESLNDAGLVIEDTPNGTRWKKK